MELFDLLRDIGVFGLAMWFIQHLLTKSADRKLETYKTELSHKTREFQLSLDSKMELYKSELNLNNYKSTQVYERQLNVIIELHKKLVKLNREMQEMTSLLKLVAKDAEKEEWERIDKTGKSYNDFMHFYQDNIIFIPAETVTKINSIRNDYWSSFSEYTFGPKYGIKSEYTYEKSKAASERVEKEIQPALEQLIKDFRKLIGSD